MQGFWRTAIVSAAVLAGSIGAANAADLYGGGMKDYGNRPALSHPATWYLRLDGAYALHDAPGHGQSRHRRPGQDRHRRHLDASAAASAAI